MSNYPHRSFTSYLLLSRVTPWCDTRVLQESSASIGSLPWLFEGCCYQASPRCSTTQTYIEHCKLNQKNHDIHRSCAFGCFIADSSLRLFGLQSARAKLGARRDKNNRQQGLTEEQKQEIRCALFLVWCACFWFAVHFRTGELCKCHVYSRSPYTRS